MPTYEFFSSEGPKGKFVASNKAIRSHAMKTALRMRPGRGDASESLISPNNSEEIIRRKDELTRRFRLTKKPKKGDEAKPEGKKSKVQTKPVSPVSLELVSRHVHHHQHDALVFQTINIQGVDPFQTLPVVGSQNVDLLVKYFLTAFNLNISTVDTQKTWFSYAMESPLLMQATLALAASFWSSSLRYPYPAIEQEGLSQKGQAMAAIRTYLSTRVAGDRVKNEILAGMGALGNVEAFHGDFTAAAVHLSAVKDLIEARGGTETILDDFHLCRCLNWVDVQVASALGRTAVFPPLYRKDEVYIPASIVRLSISPSLAHLDPLSGGDLDRTATMRTIFLLLRQVIHSQESSVVSAGSIRITMLRAETLLLSSLFGDERRNHDENDPGRQRILTMCFAAHLFQYIALREVPTRSRLASKLTSRLQAALEASNLQSNAEVWADYFPTLLWAAFVGMMATTDSDVVRFQWFSNMFSAALLKVREEKKIKLVVYEIQKLLGTFLWRDSHCMPVLNAWVEDGRGDSMSPPLLIEPSLTELMSDPGT